MKRTILYACFIMSVAVSTMSCANNPKEGDTTNNADPAVLVNDPGNSLNANPVNDTTVVDTVHNH